MQGLRGAEYLAECIWPGVTESDVRTADSRAKAIAAATAVAKDRVRYLGSLLVRDDDVVFLFFAGPSTEAVETVARNAEIPFERVLTSIRISDGTRRNPGASACRSRRWRSGSSAWKSRCRS